MTFLKTTIRLRRALKASDELHKYAADIAELTKLRDKAIQAGRLYGNSKTDYESEINRYTTQIEMCQKVHIFLLDDVAGGA